MYVRIEHLQVLHYFYFAAAIFNFSSAIITGIGTYFSYYLASFYLIHMLFSWYITLVVKRNMAYYVNFSSLWFVGKHVAVTLFAVLAALVTWLVTFTERTVVLWYTTPHGAGLLNSIAYANYLVFFMTVIWYLLFRIETVSDTMRVYNSTVQKKARDFFVRAREARRLIRLSGPKELEGYRYGKDYRLDSYMIKLWERRHDKDVAGDIRAIDVWLYRRSIESLRKSLEDAQKSGESPEYVESIRRALGEKEKRLQDYITGKVPRDRRQDRGAAGPG